MYDFKKVEEEVGKFWKSKKIFDKLRKKNKGKKSWSFIDGPITANNPMGVHHAWGRTYKDLYQRFKALQGFDQRFQNGFDCQGLWLEVETEKDLGFNSKKDIERFGLDNFSKACRKRVEKFSKVQTNQSVRLGQWMDWDNSYYTMSDENIQAIWFFLKKCYEKGWLYKGFKVLPWCIRCGTSSSQHEMSDEGYAELTHPAIYVKAKLKERENEFLLIWTTTEWTLSSNIAAAVNPDLNYCKVKQGDKVFYLSKATLHKLKGEYTLLGTIKGRELVGLEYEPFYPTIGFQKKIKHKIVGWDEVGEEEGTGIVHIAPTCGAEDYELGLEENLPLIKPALDEEGNYNEGFGWLSGKNVMQVKEAIVKDLEKRGVLYKVEKYTHRYPVCWRCKEELIFRMGSEWFIKADEIRPLMKKAADKVKWVPKHIGKLMQDWLDNMGDWNISRKRYWGLPLMFFECKCGHLEIIGSLEELKKKAVDKKLVDKLPELHRPWIDKIKVKCKCGEEVSRVNEVGDCWLDAGIVPFSTLKYFEDKKYWRKWFPAELVIEMRAQVRLWFYALLFMAVTLEGKSPYKKVFAYEEVRDEKGESMHKSKGNAIWFDDAVEKMGADIMRWIYTSSNPQYFLRFGYEIAKEVSGYLTIIWNLGNYVKQVCLKKGKIESSDLMSKWLISRRERLKKIVTESLENLQPYVALREIANYFIEDLSRTYVRSVRSELDDAKVQTVLYNSYLEGLKLLSPFLPFITEKIYLDIYKNKESIFLEDWPKFDKKLISNKLEENFVRVKQIVQEVLAQREKIGLGIRWPLGKVVVSVEEDLTEFIGIIKNQTNVKEVEIKKGKFLVKIDSKITPELEVEGYAREVMRKVQDLRKKNKFDKKDRIKLSIVSGCDISKFSKEIRDRVGAKELNFEAKKYKIGSKVEVKGKEFEISFQKV